MEDARLKIRWTNGLEIERSFVRTKIYYSDGEEYGDAEILESTAESLTLKLGKIKANDQIYLVVYPEITEFEKNLKEHNGSIIATIETEGETYYSNEWTRSISQSLADVDIRQTCNIPESTELKDGDSLIYTLKLTNLGQDSAQVYIKDTLEQGVTINKVYYSINGETKDINQTDDGRNFIGETIELKPLSKIDVVIDTSVVKELVLNQRLSNYAELEWNKETLQSNTITHTVEKREQDKTEEDYKKEDGSKENNDNNTGGDDGKENNTSGGSDNQENNTSVGNNSQENNTTNDTNQGQNNGNTGSSGNDKEQSIKTYDISGMAYYDKNKNGKLDDTEKMAEGIQVQLLDINTSKFVKTTSGSDLTVTTDNEGKYSFNDVPTGNYIVVFNYDTGVYEPTIYEASGAGDARDSNAIAKKLTIDGDEITRAVTDTIVLTQNKVNINLGLVEREIYDLKLNKKVNKVTVITSQGTEEKQFNGDLAKVEINAKYIAGSTVIVEYKIDITNEGEVAGYAKSIADYKPSDLGFDSNLNKNWYQEGDTLYTSELADAIIAPGETKSVILILTKTMTETNTGLVNNQAEIAQDINALGIADKDSTPGNRQKGEDDISSANLIINVKTGAAYSYISLVISAIVCLMAGAYLINKKISNRYTNF